jgi:hypothetical protein
VEYTQHRFCSLRLSEYIFATLVRDLTLPDIHLRAAGTILAGPGVAAGAVPANDVRLAVNELDILWALRVAITRTVLGAGLVVRVLARTAICIHGGEIDGAVQATIKLRHVDVETT